MRRSVRPRRTLSLRSRVLFLTTLLASLAVVASSVAIYIVVQDALRSQIVERVDRNATKLATSASTGVSPTALGFAVDGVAGMRVAAITSTGQLVTQSGASTPFADETGELSSELEPLARGEVGSVTFVGGGFVTAGVAATNGQIVMVAEPTSTMAPTLHTLALWLGGLGVSIIAVGAAAGSVAANTGLRPVSRLTRATRRVAETTDLRHVPVVGGDELAQFARSFNAMLSALESSRERQSTLVIDAGTELQTPLTALRTNIELLIAVQTSPTSTMDAETETALRRDIVEQLDELTGRIQRLVEDARGTELHDRS